MLRIYLLALAVLAGVAALVLEGNLRLRVVLGVVAVGAQAVVVRRLLARFRRSARLLWVGTVLLLAWVWSRWAWELWQREHQAAAVLVALALMATVSVTAYWVWQWYRQSREFTIRPSLPSSATEKAQWEPMDR